MKTLGDRMQSLGSGAMKWGGRALTAGGLLGAGVAGTQFLATKGRLGGRQMAHTLGEFSGMPKLSKRLVGAVGRGPIGRGLTSIAQKFGDKPGRRALAGAAMHVARRANLAQVSNKAIRYGGYTMLGGLGAQVGGMGMNAAKPHVQKAMAARRGGGAQQQEKKKPGIGRTLLANADDIVRPLAKGLGTSL